MKNALDKTSVVRETNAINIRISMAMMLLAHIEATHNYYKNQPLDESLARSVIDMMAYWSDQVKQHIADVPEFARAIAESAAHWYEQCDTSDELPF